MILLRKQTEMGITIEQVNWAKKEIKRIRTTLQTTLDYRNKVLSQYLAFHCHEALRLYTSISGQDITSGLQNPYAKMHERELSILYQVLKTGLSEIIITINTRKDTVFIHINKDRCELMPHP